MEQKKKIRVHRVGTITTGFSMILFGVLFLLHSFGYGISYQIIFQFWPMILIGLGIELLLANFIKKKFIYDKGAIILLFVMILFVIGMATVDICFHYVDEYIEIYTQV